MSEILDLTEGFKPKQTGATFFNDNGVALKSQKCDACKIEVNGWVDIFEHNKLIASLCNRCAVLYEKKLRG